MDKKEKDNIEKEHKEIKHKTVKTDKHKKETKKIDKKVLIIGGVILIVIVAVLIIFVPKLFNKEEPEENIQVNKPSDTNNEEIDYSNDIDKLISVTSDETKKRTKAFNTLTANDKYYIIIDNVKAMINEDSSIKSACTKDWCSMEVNAMNYYYASSYITNCTGVVRAKVTGEKIEYDLSGVNCS